MQTSKLRVQWGHMVIEISHGGSIYTREIGKCFQPGYPMTPTRSWLWNMSQHNTCVSVQEA